MQHFTFFVIFSKVKMSNPIEMRLLHKDLEIEICNDEIESSCWRLEQLSQSSSREGEKLATTRVTH